MFFPNSVSIELLSRHPNVITKKHSSYWLREDDPWIKDKSFQKKVDVLYGLDTFFLNFATEFLVFGCMCFCFHNDQVFCDVLLLNYE